MWTPGWTFKSATVSSTAYALLYTRLRDGLICSGTSWFVFKLIFKNYTAFYLFAWVFGLWSFLKFFFLTIINCAFNMWVGSIFFLCQCIFILIKMELITLSHPIFPSSLQPLPCHSLSLWLTHFPWILLLYTCVYVRTHTHINLLSRFSVIYWYMILWLTLYWITHYEAHILTLTPTAIGLAYCPT